MADAFALTIGADPGAPCQKCSALIEKDATRKRNPATWTLSQGSVRWYLCGSHAALASWTMGIRQKTFNPEGKSLHQHGAPT